MTYRGPPIRENEQAVGLPEVFCDHCRLAVPKERVDSGSPLQFCCTGCATVFQILRETGLDGYYRVRDAMGEAERPARTSSNPYLEFDAEPFQRLYERQTSRGTCEIHLFVEGVHCAACVWLIERIPKAVPGVIRAELDYLRSRVVLEWEPDNVQLSEVARFMDSIGYVPHPWRGVNVGEAKHRESRRLWMRLGVAAASAMNVMFLAIALYSGERWGIDGDLEQMFRWASFLLAIPSVLWCAQAFYVGAWASLRARVLHMDLPLSLGIVLGFGVSGWNVVRGAGHLYFDSLTMVILLLLVARWLQRRGQRAAGEAAELLQALTPSRARVLKDGGVVEVTAADGLLPGMRVEVLSGDSVPADGRVSEGRSYLNLSLLTGESLPVPVGEGEAVFAGSVNLQSRIEVVLDATGESTRIGKLVQLMDDAARRRAPIVQMADRLAGYFVAVVLALAAGTAVFWSWYDASRALEHVLALLIVSCPCALGLATPVAIAVAIGRGARNGILIKGGDAVERLASARAILLDKTGTLTEGRLSLVFWEGTDIARGLLRVMEGHSSHPVARAAVAGLAGALEIGVDDVEEVIGGGLLGRWEGKAVVVGSRAFVTSNGGSCGAAIDEAFGLAVARALTPVLVAVDGEAVGVAGFGDPLRADSSLSVHAMNRLGLKVGILSGDHPAVVRYVGEALGIEPDRVRGGLTPEQKLAAVREEAARVPLIMVGDGVNDAAALSASTVGISVHGGAEASLAAADVFLTRPGVFPVVETIRGARGTLRIIRRNLVFSLGYNVLFATLAVTGHMGPLLAAILMPFSSLTVVASSLLGRSFESGTASR